ncbi:hypothetical protein T07_11969 [Trichinella nelsoni]|uniref:Uncharacterized protein n=1 Tax=Trichinella nelsoni TaxID=6336 RepID=A0A0V0SCS2_9BILA|nr:hypothetical protein T07_11969 [Trichinella nelsoni]
MNVPCRFRSVPSLRAAEIGQPPPGQWPLKSSSSTCGIGSSSSSGRPRTTRPEPTQSLSGITSSVRFEYDTPAAVVGRRKQPSLLLVQVPWCRAERPSVNVPPVLLCIRRVCLSVQTWANTNVELAWLLFWSLAVDVSVPVGTVTTISYTMLCLG